MTTTLLRAGALACALLTTTALTAPALAQSGQTVPPDARAIDANGVDLIDGSFPFTLVEGTIGSGQSALSVERIGVGDFAASNWQNIYVSQTISGTVRTAVVVLADRSERFTSTGGGAFVAAQGNGATLTGGNGANFVHTGSDGVATTFGAPVEDQSGASSFCAHVNAEQNGCIALALSIARPNGAGVDFEWDIHSLCATEFNPDGSLDCSYGWRLGGVTNSFGYQIDFSYVSNSVPFRQMPSGDWFRRSGATLANVNVSGASRSISYNYVSSTVTEITDAGSRTWRLTTGANALGIRRPGSSSDDISVTFSGGIVTEVVRDGVATAYVRSVTGSDATTTITAGGNSTIVVADLSIGRIASVTDPLGRETAYGYDGNGRLVSVTQPEGNSLSYAYDARGNVTQVRAREKDDDADEGDDIVIEASFDPSCTNVITCNRPNTTTDANENVTEYEYDATHGGLIEMTAPAPATGATRPQTRYSYTLVNGEYQLTAISACQAGSAPTCVGTADEARTVIGYDVAGNVTSVERRDGLALTATVAATYDGFGDVASVDGPLEGTDDTTHFRYDIARRRIGTISPDPDGGGSGNPLKRRAVRIAYRADDQVSLAETGTVDGITDTDWSNFAGLEAVETAFDSNNRPVAQRLVSGSTTHALTQISYDGLGRAECVAQRMNPAEFGPSSLPADACTPDTPGSYGADRIARTYFDAAGQVSQVRTGFAVTGEEAQEVTTTYTGNGRVETLTDAEGNRTTYEYDVHDRLSRTRMPSPTADDTSSATDYEELTYDAAGSVLTRRLRDAQTIAFAYDHLNRLIDRDVPSGAYGESDIAYAYDNLGRLTAATSDNTHVVSYAYDALGRILSETGPMGTKTMDYDLAGRMVRLTWPDTFQVGYSWFKTGEMHEVREAPLGGDILLARFEYDLGGRRLSLTRGNGTVTNYSYDAVSRLTELVQNLNGTANDLTLGFTRNPASQIHTATRSNDNYAFTGHAHMSRTDTVNGLNQLTLSGSATMAYDGRGNLTNDSSSAYAYTSENRLAGGSPAVLIVYDPIGRIFQLYNYDGTTEHYTRFDHVGGTIISEISLNTGVLRRYVPGPGIDEPLVWYEGSGTSVRRYFHADERGSIVGVSDDNGNLVGTHNRYDEYGVAQETVTGRFGFTGQAWLPELGLYYYRARIYNPALGRFMQLDPIGYRAGMNLYAYVLNDPVNLVDPSGLNGCGLPDTDVPTVCGGCDGTLIATGGRWICVLAIDVRGLGWGLLQFGEGGSLRPPICQGVSLNGNAVRIDGRVEFRRGDHSPNAPGRTIPQPGTVSLGDQATYIDMINGWWSGPIGRYSVTTRLAIGVGMLTVFVGSGGPAAELGGGVMWLQPLQPAGGNPVYRANDARVAAHEFGHIMGNNHPPEGVDGGIMNRGHLGNPMGSHVDTLLGRCGLGN